MAQIIRHRKGVLESVNGAAKRKAELLIITGSSGITSTNSDAMVFFGDGTDATPANKIIYGTSTPDLTGDDYNTAVDGIPYYNTTEEKLYILAKGGNTEVKATANTGGTDIISGSQGIIDNIAGQDVVLGGISGSSLDITGNSKIDGNLVLGGNITIGDASTDTIAFGGDITTDIIPNADGTLDLGSAADKFAEVHATNLYGIINGEVKASNNVVSGSTDSSKVDFTIADGIITADLIGGVISGSTQLDGTVIGNSSDIEASGSFSGSFKGDGSGLTGLATNLDVNGSDVDLLLDDLDIIGTANEIAVSTAKVGTDVTVTVSLPDDVTIGNDLTVTGDLTVSGTTTTVDSETLNISGSVIRANYGGGAVQGGLEITDATGTLATGSLLWDGTNDYWIGGALGSEVKLLREHGDSVVSGSAQVTSGAAASEILIRHASDSTIDGASIYSLPSTSTIAINDSTPTSIGTSGEMIINGTTSGYSGVLTQDLGGTTVYNQYATSADSLVNFMAASGYGLYFSVDGDTKAWTIDTDGDLVAGGNFDVYAQDFRATGDISGSNLKLTGNAVIDGNITLGGDITLGDANGDSIAFGGELTTDIIPDVNNSVDLGSSSRVFAEIHGTVLNATTFKAASGDVISGSAQLLNQATNFGSGRVSGDDFGDADGGSTFTGSFVGDGSGISGLSTDLSVSGSDGSNDTVALLNGALTFAGGTGVSTAVATDTVTISVQDASTSAKGITSFNANNFSVTTGNTSLLSGNGVDSSGGVLGANLNADTAGDGLTYSLSNQQLDVDYGSSAGTAVQGNTTATFTGTTNEITVSDATAQPLGGGVAVTIGLPTDVTIADTLTVNGNVTLGNATTDTVTIAGNLTVEGTTTTIDSTTVNIGDNILELNIGGAQTTAGLLVADATGTSTASGSLVWDGANGADYWKAGPQGSELELARLNATPTGNTVLKANGDGVLVDSVLSDDGTDATFSGDLTVTGLGAGANGAFLYADADEKLVAVNATTAGDVIQWDGSSFVASNELDGGTF